MEVNFIYYVRFVLHFPIIYYVLTILIAVGVWIWKKELKLSLLTDYCFIIYAMAVLHRQPTPDMRYEIHLFWSWKQWEILGLQILANIIVFIPIGYLSGSMWKWRGMIYGSIFSFFIVISQLLTHRGLFELDDIIHNSF